MKDIVEITQDEVITCFSDRYGEDNELVDLIKIAFANMRSQLLKEYNE